MTYTTEILANVVLSQNTSQGQKSAKESIKVTLNSKYKVLINDLIETIKSKSEVEGCSSKYCSKKVRFYLAHLVFGKQLTELRWSTLRKIAFEFIRYIQNNQKVSHTINLDKSKILDSNEVTSIVLSACFLAKYHPHHFPNLKKVPIGDLCERLGSWHHNVKHAKPDSSLASIEVLYPNSQQSNDSRFNPQPEIYGELEVNVPWFQKYSTSPPSHALAKLISYEWLMRSMAKTFYGYTPTPQYLGKLGFPKPQTRLYSLADYIKIRNSILTSASARKRHVNWVKLPNTPDF